MPPELGLFDLVVIDEASQSDIWALPALLRGKKLLVVGDHKQVSPSVVGMPEQKIVDIQRRFLDEKCVQTIQNNLDIPITQLKLTPENSKSLPAADILIGGFPCQEFSSCGPLGGLDSERGQLYKVLVSYMKKHKPKIVCAENVPNLARMQSGNVLKIIVEDFKKSALKNS